MQNITCSERTRKTLLWPSERVLLNETIIQDPLTSMMFCHFDEDWFPVLCFCFDRGLSVFDEALANKHDRKSHQTSCVIHHREWHWFDWSVCLFLNLWFLPSKRIQTWKTVHLFKCSIEGIFEFPHSYPETVGGLALKWGVFPESPPILWKDPPVLSNTWGVFSYSEMK